MRSLLIPGNCASAAVLALAALSLAAAASLGSLQSLALAGVLLPVLIGLSRLRLPGLLIAFLIATNLVHLLKRFIFLLGPQPQSIYFAVQLLPSVILGLLFLSAIRRWRGKTLPASGKLLVAFVGVNLVMTGLSLSIVPYPAALAAVHQQLLPVLMFFVGLSVTLDELSSAGRVLVGLAAVSVGYGMIQLVTGPTVMDQAWAAGTFSYSVHGSKVFDYLQGSRPEFRAYSYYADPTTWGMFLVAGFVGAAVARARGQMRKGYWALTLLLIPAGLFATLTRTCWVSFAGTIGAYLALRYRPFRRPWVLFATVIAAFALTVAGGGWLYQKLFLERRLPIVDNAWVARYLTVGTIEARISAWDALQDAIARKPQGYGVMPYVKERSEAPDWDRPLFTHNFIVELVLNSGVLGAFLFLLFYLQWLRESSSILKATTDGQAHRAIRWMVAFSAGSMMSGYWNGLNFATYEYFLVMGVLAGLATSRSLVRRVAPAPGPERFRQACPALAGLQMPIRQV